MTLLRSAVFCLCAWLVSSPALAGLPAPPPCDPHVAQLRGAETAIQHGDYASAQGIVANVLRGDPTDFHAQFLASQVAVFRVDRVDEDRGVGSSPEFTTAIVGMIALAKRLDGADAACFTMQDLQRIDNTIGAEYLNRKQLGISECYLLKAYEGYRPRQANADTRTRVVDNIALNYLYQGKMGLARDYYDEAAKSNGAVARYQLSTNKPLRDSTPTPHAPTDAARLAAACAVPKPAPGKAVHKPTPPPPP